MTSVAELSGVEVLRMFSAMEDLPPNIGDLLGMRFESIDEGAVALSVHARPDMTNPIGTLHGGICATLLDSAMGCAVHSALPAGVGYGTLELKVNYIRSVPTDGRRLVATGRTIHVGGKTATASGEVRDEEGRLIAHGTTTCSVHR